MFRLGVQALYTIVRIMGMLGALGTVAAIVCYPLVSDSIRHQVLYYGFCALALTVGIGLHPGCPRD
jgi:hypothetical protein